MSVSHHCPLPGQHWMGPSFPKSPFPSYLSTVPGMGRLWPGIKAHEWSRATSLGRNSCLWEWMENTGGTGEQSCLGAMMGCPGDWAGVLGESCGLGWT